jgi:hypothetical protein
VKISRADIRRTANELMRGRYRGYFAAGAVVLLAGVYGATRTITPAERRAAAPAAGSGPATEEPGDGAPAQPPETTGKLAGGAPAPEPLPAADPATRVARPAAVRGIYLNAWAAGSDRKLTRLIDLANATEINTFVVDVKEAGEISYRSAVPLAHEIGAGRVYVRDMKGVLDRLKANGIYPVARIVVFRDPILAEARPDLAVQKVDGTGVWEDTHGYKWVDSFNRAVWDYNIAIAREAIRLGFSEIQWDYVRFPDVPLSHMRTAEWPARNGRTKEDGIREFLLYAREQLADLNVPITADVFGLTVSAGDDLGIGQRWAKMVDATDALLPMIYPSHFARGSYGIAEPNAEPYDVVKTALEHARRRTADVPNAARVIPWLQDFTLGPPRYSPWHVRAQIRAVYDAGYDEWVLWHPGSNYSVEALASEDGEVPQLVKPPLERSVPRGPRILGVPVKGS